jgi:hypothetical protein
MTDENATSHEAQPDHSSSGRDLAQEAYEAEVDKAFWDVNNAIAAQIAATQCPDKDPQCPNQGWPVPCSKCGYCLQNPDELTPLFQSPESIAVDEIIAEELSELMEYRREVAGEVIGLTYPESTPDAWIQPATQDDLDYQESHYPPDFDDDSWDDDDTDNGFYGDEDYADSHALRDPIDGKVYCPYCNSECAPDFCYGCQSALLSPPVDLSFVDDTDSDDIDF